MVRRILLLLIYEHKIVLLLFRLKYLMVLSCGSTMPDISGVTIKDECASDDGDSNPSNGNLWKYKLPSNSTSKEATVGSLSFNVIDTSPRKQLTEPPKQVALLASEDTGKLANSSQQQKPAVRKPAPRAKVPFEKGYSQMDWLKLCRTHPDLAGTDNLQCFIVELRSVS